ncbi:MAG: P27 family phage terminase small subunit [Bacteroidaceae bacterium]|nr:P27 family phage terminase small subunit [Bacteroidaceae bacterium]
MDKDLVKYEKKVRAALKAAGTYSKSLEINISMMAVALQLLEKASREVSNLDGVTVTITQDNGFKRQAMHPAFEVIRSMMDRVIKLMKPLGLTVEMITSDDDIDPMVELTKKVIDSSDRPKILKPKKDD